MHTTRRTDPRRAKIRDMGRSVLPSTSRKSSRDSLNAVRRKGRRRESRVLAEIERSQCLCDTEDICPRCDHDVNIEYPLSEHRYAIADRREADKFGPLYRWAETQVAGIEDLDERRRHMRAMLPPGLIGWHAMSHLEYRVIDTEPRWYGPVVYRHGRPLEIRKALVRSLAEYALEHGWHTEFNRATRHFSDMTWNGDAEPFLNGPRGQWNPRNADYRERQAAEKKLAASPEPQRWTRYEIRGWFVGEDGRSYRERKRLGAYRPLAGIDDIDTWLSEVEVDMDDTLEKWGKSIGWVPPKIS